MTLALRQQFTPQFNNPIVSDHQQNKKVAKTMLIQVNIICVCVCKYEFELFGVFVIGLAILSFCLNIKSRMGIQSCIIGLSQTIESSLDNDDDHDHYAAYSSNCDIIHNNTIDLYFGVAGNTRNNGNNPNQSAACGNGSITNKVKSGDDE